MIKRSLLIVSIFAIYIIVFFPSSLFSAIQVTSHVKAELVAEVSSIQPGRPFWIAVHLKMDKGWHIYWKNPGEAGMATHIAWQLPPGLTAGEIKWPYPKIFVDSRVVTYGYEGEVCLLSKIETNKLLKSGNLVIIKASLDWLVCHEGCVPGEVELNLKLPVKKGDPQINPEWSRLYKKIQQNLPRKVPGWKISATYDSNKIIIKLSPPLSSTKKLLKITFLPEQEGVVDYSAPQNVRWQEKEKEYILEIKRSKLLKTPQRLKGIIFTKQGWDKGGQVLAMSLNSPLSEITYNQK